MTYFEGLTDWGGVCCDVGWKFTCILSYSDILWLAVAGYGTVQHGQHRLLIFTWIIAIISHTEIYYSLYKDMTWCYILVHTYIFCEYMMVNRNFSFSFRFTKSVTD